MPRILVVDDDPLALEIVMSLLCNKGATPDSASDGFAALRMLRDNRYDLIFVDYHLPEMDGYALAKLMRDLCAGRETPLRLVGITADRHGLAARRGVDGIFDAILTKPLRPAELFEQLDLVVCVNGVNPSQLAAAALLANPDFERARAASMAFWRARGLAGHPRIAIFPTPEASEAEELRSCFDVVEQSSAELLLLLNVRGLQELLLIRMNGETVRLPVVTFDESLLPVCDGRFDVADRTSWTDVADLLKRKSA